MADASISCRREGCGTPVQISDAGTISRFMFKLRQLYRQSTLAADNAAQYWADVAATSRSPLAPLAHVPGVFAALWTPDVAPTTATVLGAAGYGFAALPKNLIHFTTEAGAAAIARTGAINSSRFIQQGIYGPGVYMTRIGRPLNLFIDKASRVPIHLPTPAGTVRIYPYFVYVRWGATGVKVP
ncbi:hypothetical protein [Paracidovorax anthurii]|uniref:Uncharacterized protein n=1 Tax=Paracidovorax anthurii TaxID=78229 RepID=A0A328ZC82_9BURK|nr:hypothetical protein [Paracidovorax anthurii]RAR83254.1 hypothetical protein AX018_1015100 [Paracidovorax anthurii]